MARFEDKIITFAPKPLFEDKALQDKLFQKKVEVVDAYRPKETDFSDIYSQVEIQDDLKEIQRLEKEWDDKEKTGREIYIEKISSIYEAVIADQISANAWFGENCDSIPASRFDDIKNGVDVVTIFNTEKSTEYVGLGVDVTFSSDDKVLEKNCIALRSVLEVCRCLL